MSRENTLRIVLAVAAGYIANGVLVAATEQLLALRASGLGSTQAASYFVFDLTSQCLYTVVGGYLCGVIAGPRRTAIAGLIGLGVLVGTVSLVTSWKTEPHWYGIALLSVYPPCVWIGWILRGRTHRDKNGLIGL